MFSVIYTFKVKDGKDQDFLDGWTGLTKLIYKHEGSLGSKVHKDQNGNYVACAQWPSREVWENTGANLPKVETEKFRAQMKNSCYEMETLFELDLVVDLTKDVLFGADI